MFHLRKEFVKQLPVKSAGFVSLLAGMVKTCNMVPNYKEAGEPVNSKGRNYREVLQNYPTNRPIPTSLPRVLPSLIQPHGSLGGNWARQGSQQVWRGKGEKGDGSNDGGQYLLSVNLSSLGERGRSGGEREGKAWWREGGEGVVVGEREIVNKQVLMCNLFGR